MVERTILIIKPDAIEKKLTGTIISRIEKLGVNIINIKTVKGERNVLRKHYVDIGNLDKVITMIEVEKILQSLEKKTMIVLEIEGPLGTLESVLKEAGDKEPSKAYKGTIRGDYAWDNYELAFKERRQINNLIEVSKDWDSYTQEKKLWFQN